MQIILLSGGSGKRLWPLSNDVRSKQFIKIFEGKDGEPQSMVQRMYQAIKRVIPEVGITVATGLSQVPSINNQLGDNVNICVEPARRDTFPAIALASLFLRDVKNISEDEAIVVCPVDPYVNDSYFNVVKRIGECVDKHEYNLTLMGIKPTYPSAKYGYILSPDGKRVSGFKEKPDLEGAKRLLEQNAMWNGGVFGFRLGYMTAKTEEITGYGNYEELKNGYESVTKISIDYAVAEKETSIGVIPFDGDWLDVGTWKTLTEVMKNPILGDVTMDDHCEETHVINELDIPILAMGINNAIIAAGPDGIIVADKDRSSYMKPFVDKIQRPVMYAEKSWGSYRVLDMEEESLTIKVTLMPGHKMNYHSHERRDEVWTVISGEGFATIDDRITEVKAGDSLLLPAGCKHMLEAKSLLKVMEVQTGKDIDVNDKIKY